MDAIYSVKGICQAHLSVKRPLHLVIVDFKKTFDGMLQDNLISVLRELNAPEDLVRLMQNLYMKAQGTILWK